MKPVPNVFFIYLKSNNTWSIVKPFFVSLYSVYDWNDNKNPLTLARAYYSVIGLIYNLYKNPVFFSFRCNYDQSIKH